MAELFCWLKVDDVPMYGITRAARNSPGIFGYKKTTKPMCVIIGAITKEEAAKAVFLDKDYYHRHYLFEEVKDEIIQDIHIWEEPSPIPAVY